MNRRLEKIVRKGTQSLPLFVLVGILIWQLQVLPVPMVIAMVPVFAFLYIWYQMFNYDFYNEITYEDYLESKHSNQFPFSEKAWEYLQKDSVIQKQKWKKLTEDKEHLTFEKMGRYLDTKRIEITKFEGNITIEVAYKKFTSFPDQATNFKLMRSLEKNISKLGRD